MSFVLAADSATTWTALAAIAQAVAAFGAIALLLTTYLSLRDASAALEHSDRLATQTEGLVQAMRDAQVLAVKPVIELRRDRDAEQLTISNVGNGPLLDPLVACPGRSRRLQALDGETYVEVGALKVGHKAFVILEGPDRERLTLSGFTSRGDQVSWEVRPQAFGARPVIVAKSDQDGRKEAT